MWRPAVAYLFLFLPQFRKLVGRVGQILGEHVVDRRVSDRGGVPILVFVFFSVFVLILVLVTEEAIEVVGCGLWWYHWRSHDSSSYGRRAAAQGRQGEGRHAEGGAARDLVDGSFHSSSAVLRCFVGWWDRRAGRY